MTRLLRLLPVLVLLGPAAAPVAAVDVQFSSYLGGTVADQANAAAVDAAGNVYLTGATTSVGFPGAAGHFQSANAGGASDAFVTKVSSSGVRLWSTYLGGTADDIGLGIAVDAAGKVYITGSTTGSFPGTLLGTGGGTEAFVAAFSADGTALIYAHSFGGPQEESGNGIAVDAAGNAYVTGHTDSLAAASFPVTAGAAQTVAGGGDEAFVSKFTPAGALAYSTYLGGTGLEHGNAIAIDASGNAYVSGQCTAAFPVVAGAFKPTITGASDAFLTKLDPTGAAFLYSTYIGGNTLEEATGIALGGANIVYLTGWTDSTTGFPDTGFALTGQIIKGTGVDAFVMKLDLAGGGAHADGVYATYLGASGADVASAIAVDPRGNAYVTGRSVPGGFPTVDPLSVPNPGGTGKAFLAQVSTSGSSLGFATELGGSTDQGGRGIGLDAGNNIFVAGWTDSTDFPTAAAFQGANAGATDAFITKLSPAVDIVAPSISITRPPAGSLMNQVSTAAVVVYSDTGGSGLDLTSFTLRLDGNLVTASAGASSATAVLSGLSGGAHTLDATIADNDGNATAAVQISFTVDLATPTIAIVLPPGGSFVNSASTAAIVDYADSGGSGLNLSSLIIRLDSVAVPAIAGLSRATAALSGLSAGLHTLDASIADNAGNLAAAVQTSFTVALGSPTIAISRPPNGAFLNYTSTTALIGYADVSGSGLALGSLVVKLDGVGISATALASSATAILAALAPGPHTLDAAITDNAGNTSSATQVGFSVDLTTPTIAISVPVNGSFLIGTSTTAVIGYADGGGSGLVLASLQVRLDSVVIVASVAAGSATALLAGLAPGSHTLDAAISDGAGNRVDAVQASFTVPAAVCTISGVSPLSGPALGGNLVTITGTGFHGFAGSSGVTFGGADASSYSVNSASTVIVAMAPRHPLVGLLTSGPIQLMALTGAGSCSIAYSYDPEAAGCSGEYFYPSPASGATGTFAYCMARAGTARIRVYNVIGDAVATLEDHRAAGAQTSTLNTGRLAPGVYLYRLEKDYGGGDVVRSSVEKFAVRR